MTGGVLTVLYLEVFSTDSKTTQFNRAVDRIKKDPRCLEVLGNAKKIKAYGEPTSNRLSRNRPLASTTRKDPTGTEHLLMHFHVEGPLNKGVVQLHMVKPPNQKSLEYKYLALDVKGHPRIYLERKEDQPSKSAKSPVKFLGVRWS
ncbi:MAG: hypothetical protein M1823_000055 [Watsoniomyces obsoletus]|nr:MAG: hypothetical protein M1823_000055 [Watsoniomyces obsoletus]